MQHLRALLRARPARPLEVRAAPVGTSGAVPPAAAARAAARKAAEDFGADPERAPTAVRFPDASDLVKSQLDHDELDEPTLTKVDGFRPESAFEVPDEATRPGMHVTAKLPLAPAAVPPFPPAAVPPFPPAAAPPPAPAAPATPPPAAPDAAATPGVTLPAAAAAPLAAGIAEAVAGAMQPVLAKAVDAKVAEIATRGPEYAAIAALSRDVIEQIAWEVVPELAEVIIRAELDRLVSERGERK
jgi:hypothetical protein